jgi:choline dehydrogenase-like flavoprotein
MSANHHYDVIIIGTGAGGGTLAYRMAPSGKKILLLERGDFVPREKQNWDSRAVVGEGRYNNVEPWRDIRGNEFVPGAHYFVGGNTKFYGAALVRLRKQDFGELRHHSGVSPAWPLSYEDLEPYYTEAEYLYQVHGIRGEDPTEPPASKPYRFPPISHESRIQQLSDDLQKLGHRPFHLPVGVLLDERNPQKSKCIRCSTCDGFPCLVQAKADAHVICVEPALQHSNLTLMTKSKVTLLETDPSGRVVTRVHVDHDGVPETYSANIVVSSCGAANSAALMLRSANDKHPNGLGNSSDQVGRNYMCHTNSVMLALSKCENPTIFQKTFGLNDFYFASKEWDFPMGHISFVGKSDADILSAGAPKIVPGFTLDLMAKHSLDFWMTSEDLPDPNNRVTVTRAGQIQLSYKPNNEEGHKRLQAKLKSLLKDANCTEEVIHLNAYIGKRIPLAGVAHQNGTLRFGRDPKASVLDLNCKMHDLENLYAVDASFFPSCGAMNPALTIMANALRVGDHLIERLS